MPLTRCPFWRPFWRCHEQCAQGCRLNHVEISCRVWRNSTIISQNVVEEVRKLKEQPGKDIYVDGSSVLVHTLTQAGLVDEYSLLVFPLVLGSGKQVFPNGLRADLKLIETKSFPTGVILLRYQPDGKE